MRDVRNFTREPPAAELNVWPLPDRPATVARARDLVRGACTALGFDAETTGDAVVMVSELATNAIRHARPPYELRLHRGGRILTCEFADASPILPRIPRGDRAHLTLDDIDAAGSGRLETGRGLFIVSRLSGGRCGAWPVLLHPGGAPVRGKSVWFALDLP